MRCSMRGLKLLPVTTAHRRPSGLRTMPSGRSLTSMWVPAGVIRWPVGTRILPSGCTPILLVVNSASAAVASTATAISGLT